MWLKVLQNTTYCVLANGDAGANYEDAEVDMMSKQRSKSMDSDIKETKKSEQLNYARLLSKKDIHPYEEIKWDKRDAEIKNEKGEVVFSQKEVEVPAFWSQTATNIVVSKYFRGKIGTKERETSVKQMINRVAKTIAHWGNKGNYFQNEEEGQFFEDELTYILVNQYAAFNSPVWFNVGIEPQPQCSACFINSVEDSMKSILNLAVTEGMLFKYGSGTGTNLSPLRSSREYLNQSEGRSSGPVSFMKGFDSFAGVIKSGGKTRRAAKMVILNVDHPDIIDFIDSKAHEEKKAWALIDAGYDGSFNGEAYSSVFFQNANNSVRVTDEFMNAVEKDGTYYTKYVTTGKTCEELKARNVMKAMGEAAHICGDPGIQYDTTINKWHTCKNTSRINASNPCSEYMFVDNSSCNLASINLMKFQNSDGSFDVERYKHVVKVMISAQEMIVDNASYPTEKITQNSYDYRPLGLGYANLGALLMSRGLPYDSDKGRNFAAAITSILSGYAYSVSSRIASKLGPFKYYKENESSMLEVIGMHKDEAYKISKDGVPEYMLDQARSVWDEALEFGKEHGYKNSQISVLAPTGTIGFLMDCDTTGIEPDIALVKYKWLVGGGMIKIVNRTVPLALKNLGYNKQQVEEIMEYIDQKDTIEGAPHLKEEQFSVFDCAFRPKNGSRYIHYMGHVRMMAAVQPFISGAISKTVNMPKEATAEEIMQVYIEAWKIGIKAMAIYRDGSKRTQPLTTSMDDEMKSKKTQVVFKPMRRKLPDERTAVTHKFKIVNHTGYITVGLFDDGMPGEIFIVMSKEGSVISGLMDAFATSISMALQYGVPLKVLVNKFVHMRFEPAGFTNNPHIQVAKSIIDYIFRWLGMKFLPSEDWFGLGLNDVEGLKKENGISEGEPKLLEEQTNLSSDKPKTDPKQKKLFEKANAKVTFDVESDAPPCDMCGSIMVRNGSCYKCLNCGATSGCS